MEARRNPVSYRHFTGAQITDWSSSVAVEFTTTLNTRAPNSQGSGLIAQTIQRFCGENLTSIDRLEDGTHWNNMGKDEL